MYPRRKICVTLEVATGVGWGIRKVNGRFEIGTTGVQWLATRDQSRRVRMAGRKRVWEGWGGKGRYWIDEDGVG
jgi:hypothetical protein